MGKQFDKKITWVIKNFSTLQSETICSDEFVVGGCKWFLKAYPKGNNTDNYPSLFLRVPDSESLPAGWRRHARCLLTVVNQNSGKNIQLRELREWFDKKFNNWGRTSIVPLNELHAKDSGFLVKGDLKIVAEIEVLKVIGKLDVTEETSTITETMNVNGFQLLPSHAKFGRLMFERHPEFASELRSKNPKLRTAYMSLLLSLVETMCQLPQELSKDVISDTYAALGSLKHAGFKLDWLEKKLDEMLEKKEKDQASETRLREMEQELKGLKRKWSDMEALVDKKKGNVLAAKKKNLYHWMMLFNVLLFLSYL